MKRWLLGITAGTLTAATLATGTIYAYDHNRIRPQVMVADVPVGRLTVDEARTTLSKRLTDYRLKLQIDQRQVTYKPAELGVVYDVEATLKQAFSLGRNGEAPTDRRLDFTMSVNSKKLQQAISMLSTAEGVQPVDAAVKIVQGKPQVVPEHPGKGLDARELEQIIRRNMAKASTTVHPVKPKVLAATINAASAEAAVGQAEQKMALKLSFSNSDHQVSPNPAQIASWLKFEPNTERREITPMIDEGKLRAYVKTIAKRVDIPAISRQVRVENGISKLVREGRDGQAIDQAAVVTALKEAITSNQPLEFNLELKPVPHKTESTNIVTLDLGRYIEINITKQRLWVWQDNQVIHEAPITTGAAKYADLATPVGLYSIYAKQSNRYLSGCWRGECYKLHVDYWMPFNSAVGLHDASWRNGVFGTPDYYYNGSHGCVNLPDATAKFIWNWSTVGTPVWVHK